MRNFDNNIGRWCNKCGITYTRYCDDMTFSSDELLYPVYQKVKTMLEETGLELNENKTHFVSSGSRQTVTGLTVNEKVSVSCEYKRQLRQEVHYALKFGLTESTIAANRKKFIDEGLPNPNSYRQNLLGRINFVLQIEPGNQWFRTAVGKLNEQG